MINLHDKPKIEILHVQLDIQSSSKWSLKKLDVNSGYCKAHAIFQSVLFPKLIKTILLFHLNEHQTSQTLVNHSAITKSDTMGSFYCHQGRQHLKLGPYVKWVLVCTNRKLHI